ncbi:hypothetical protein UC34_25460 [Pandoraea vervacti]|uniref:Uncharacterized protein n=2 Tax=Pandoraea vervacti TaxID=656178 RepID=A0ABN4U882_9BURK|nr:hypothetical protein UC34_25460 [Pandoraea vervacti]
MASGLSLFVAMTAAVTNAGAATASADALPPAAPPATATRIDRHPDEMPPPPTGPRFGGPQEHCPLGSAGPMGARGPGFGPGFAAARTIEEIAHLYRVGGHPESVLPFYRETLSQTRDPMLRRHLREAIAREALKPADTTAAITTLRAQLNEDLAALTPAETRRR